MEKLFVQIFERKKWIIEQVRHQAQLFDQHLASTLLIDGITPPPWLLQPSHPSEFKKEELISELLAPHAPVPNPYSFYNCSVYGNTRGDLREFQDRSQDGPFTNDIGKDKLSYPSEFPIVGNESVQNGVSEIDPTVMSPQDQRELNVPDTYYDVDESLARLQRSKARQKALELRNSAKSSSSSLHKSKGAEVHQSRIPGSEIHAPLAIQILNEESVHCYNSSCSTSGAVHGRINKKGGNSQSGRVTRSMTSGRQFLHVDKSAKSGISSSIVKGGNGESLEVPGTVNSCTSHNSKQRLVEENRRYFRRQVKGSNSDSDIVRRSEMLHPDACVDESLELEGFDPVAREKYIAKPMQQGSCVEHHMEMNGSYGLHEVEAGASQNNEDECVSNSGRLVKTRNSLCQLNDVWPSRLDNMVACDGRIAKHAGALLQLQQVENSFGRVAEPHDPGNKLASPNIQTRFDGIEKTTYKKSLTADDMEKELCLQPSVPSNIIDDVDLVSSAVIAGGFANSAKDAPAKFSSDLDDANCEVESDKVSCASTLKMLKPKLLDFDDKGECQSIANEVACISSEDKILEEEVVDRGAEEKSDDLYDANCTNTLENLELGSNRKVLTQTLLDFDDKGEHHNTVNEVTINMLDDRRLKEVPMEDMVNSLKEVYQEEEGNSSEICFENCADHMDGGSIIPSQVPLLLENEEVQVNIDDHMDGGSVIPSPVPLLLENEAVQVNIDDPNCSLEGGRRTSSSENHTRDSDAAKLSPLDSGETAIGYDFLKVPGSTDSSYPNTKLEDCEVDLHGKIPAEGNSSELRQPDALTCKSPCHNVDLSGTCIVDVQNLSDCKSYGCSIRKNLMQPGIRPLQNVSSQPSQSSLQDKFTKQFSTSSTVHSVDGSIENGNLGGQESDQNGGLTLENILLKQKQDTAELNVSRSPIDLMQGSVSCPEGFDSLAVQQTEEDAKMSSMYQGSETSDSRSRTCGVSLQSSSLRRGTAKSQCPLADEAEIVGFSSIDGERKSPDEKEHQLLTQHKLEIACNEGLAPFGKSLGDTACHVDENLGFSYQMVGTPKRQPLELSSAAEMMPVFEGFTMQTVDEQPCISMDECSFEKFDGQDFTIERASIVEQLCQSACLHAPLSPLSAAAKLQKVSNMYYSVPNGLLENISFTTTFLTDGGTSEVPTANFVNKEVDQGSVRWSSSDPLPFSGVQSAENQNKPYMSPVGKLWDRISSSSGSSKEKVSLHSELPCISEESENVFDVADAPVEDICSDTITCSLKRTPLAEITEDPNCLPSVSETQDQTIADRYSIDSVNTEISFNGTNRRIKQKTSKDENSRRHNGKIRNSKPVRRGASGVDRPMELLQNRLSKAKTSLRKDGPSISGKDSKQGNIVCNVTSFLPLVQQKPTVAPLAGKRDVKVKALEAAEAAKRQAEKREIERKMKKEALKLERARAEQENFRQQELLKRKKEEERKEREANLAKKRHREEEERKEKERKRRRHEEARKHRGERAKMEEKETNHNGMQESKNEAKKKKVEESVKTEKRTCTVAGINKGLENICQNPSIPPETCQTPINIGDTAKVISILHEAIDGEHFVSSGTMEKSYEISPYQCSDDEDEEEDDVPNSKFIPSWASKSHIAMAACSQDSMDPEAIFPPDSFCSISEVVLPRRFQQR